MACHKLTPFFFLQFSGFTPNAQVLYPRHKHLLLISKGNAERKTKPQPLVGFRFRFFGHMPKRVNSKFHEKTVQGFNYIYNTRGNLSARESVAYFL